jgi:hypothetical protein
MKPSKIDTSLSSQNTINSYLYLLKSSIRIHLCIFLLVFISSTSFTQTTFCEAVGGPGTDLALEIVNTTDGGYITGGYTNSYGAGGYDFYVVKFDASGALQWTKTIGGTGSDYARSIIQTTDGGYAVAGYTTSFGAGNYDAYIVKLNAAGALQWTRTIGGTGDDRAYSVIQTTDGGYITAGYTSSFGAGSWDFYFVKLDAAGVIQWTKTVGGSSNEAPNSVIQTNDGGYAAVGHAVSYGAGIYAVYVVKLSAAGALQWTRTVGGTGRDYGLSIVQTAAGDYTVGGYTESFGAGSRDAYIVKLNSAGVVQWTKTIGGAGFDYAYSMTKTTDGGYVVGGYTNSYGAGGYDVYVAKLDASGALQWTKTFGGAGDDYAYSVIQTSDGGYAVAGRTISFGVGSGDVYVIKLDASGGTCCTSSSGGVSGNGGVSSNGGVIGSGGVSGSGGVFSSGGTFNSLCLVLPIELLSFSGKKEGSSNLLKWETASEINNDFFTLEKSANAHNWEVVGRLSGVGNSNTIHTYSMTDDSPFAITYYRLKQTDFNGDYNYSNIETINNNEREELISIYPNPVSNGFLILDINNAKNQKLQMLIIDVFGKKVFEQEINVSKAEKKYTITLPSIKSGSYWVTLLNTNSELVGQKQLNIIKN